MKKYSVRKTVQKIKEDKLVLDFLEDLSDKARTEYLQTITESCQVTGKTPKELRTISKQKQEDKISPSKLSIKKNG